MNDSTWRASAPRVHIGRLNRRYDRGMVASVPSPREHPTALHGLEARGMLYFEERIARYGCANVIGFDAVLASHALVAVT